MSSEVNSISGLIEIFAPLGMELGTVGGVDDPPPPPQLARHETIIEESTNLSNFITFFDNYSAVGYNDKSILL